MSENSTLFSTAPIICHIFATPVTNILINTEIAVKNLPEEAKNSADIYLQRVLLNAQYLHSVLQLENETSAQYFSPQSALKELLALNGDSKLKKHVVSRWELPTNFQLRGNKLAFQEMVVCLLNNAYESYSHKKHHKPIFLSVTLNKYLLNLSVVDGGRGMGWLKGKLCTTQFYSTKNNHLGLGLYFVKKTVEQEFAGRLWLSSRRGKGTVVTLNFPLQNHSITKPPSGLQNGVINA